MFLLEGREVLTVRVMFRLQGGEVLTVRVMFRLEGGEVRTVRVMFLLQGCEVRTVRVMLRLQGREVLTVRVMFRLEGREVLSDLRAVVEHVLVPLLKGGKVFHDPPTVATKRVDIAGGGFVCGLDGFNGVRQRVEGGIVPQDKVNGVTQAVGDGVDSSPPEGGEESLDDSRSKTLGGTILFQPRGQFFKPASNVLLGGDRILPVKLPRGGEEIISS
jgi:hypothetical protein